jgi:hypothetical protein
MSDDDGDVGTALEGLGSLKLPRRERACAQCEFSARENPDRVCRKEPPKVFLFMVPVGGGAALQRPGQPAMQIITQTCFPVVRDDQWCGGFQPRFRDS